MFYRFCTKFLRTDNGMNFTGANNLLRREIKAALKAKYASKEFQNKMEKWEIQSEASQHGDLYELHIRNIRKVLQGMFLPCHRNPSDDEFFTCMKMVECIINCRPLTRSVSEEELALLRSIDQMVGALEPSTECSYPCITEPGNEIRRGHRYTKKSLKCGRIAGCNCICQR